MCRIRWLGKSLHPTMTATPPPYRTPTSTRASRTRGLATHTKAIVTGSLNDGGEATFAAEVALAPQKYTIIAHTRLMVMDPSHPKPYKLDVAIGMFTTVTTSKAETSDGAVIQTAIGGTVVLFILAAAALALKKGLVQPEKAMESLINGPITGVMKLLFTLADVIAFSFTVHHIYQDPDENTVNVLPFAFLVLIVGWSVSVIKFVTDTRHVCDHYVLQDKNYISKVTQIAVLLVDRQRAAERKPGKSSSLFLAKKLSQVGEKDELTIAGRTLAVLHIELRQLYYVGLQVVMEQIPMIVCTSYLIANSNQVYNSDVVAMFFAASALGYNVRRIMEFPAKAKERNKITNQFNAMEMDDFEDINTLRKPIATKNTSKVKPAAYAHEGKTGI